MNLIDTGIENRLIRFDEDRNFITYIHQNKKRNYNNPEEKVQAETFLTLVLIYCYPNFTALAEDIGYDATGRSTNNNELTEIGEALATFIAHINKTEQ